MLQVLGNYPRLVAFALMMACHDVSAETCHKRMLQGIPKMLVALSGPVQLATFFSRLTRTSP